MKFNNMKTKRSLPSLKKFAPTKIGSERGKLLSDDEMMSMHKHKMGSDMKGKVTAPNMPHIPRATMMYKAKED